MIKETIGFKRRGDEFWLTTETKVHDLEVGIYEAQISMSGFYLNYVSSNFDFPYKVYGLESDFIARVNKYYINSKSGNLGILLNGLKGTGKSCSAKVISNTLKLPVVIVGSNVANETGILEFINSLPQDIVIFIDEYEKIFGESSKILSIMDGASNSMFRRVFLLTTNSLYIDQNLIDRPSRIRYLKKFDNLTTEIVEEIVDDMLIHPEFKGDCIKYISTLEVITVDMVKSVITEVNIMGETPSVFGDVFNATKIKGSYDVFKLTKDAEPELIRTKVGVHPCEDFNDNTVGRNLQVDGEYLGEIVKILGPNTCVLKTDVPIIEPAGSRKRKPKYKEELMVIRVTPSMIYNYNYTYGRNKSSSNINFDDFDINEFGIKKSRNDRLNYESDDRICSVSG